MSPRSTRSSTQGGHNRTPANKKTPNKNKTTESPLTHTPNNTAQKRKSKTTKETTPKSTDSQQLTRQTSMDEYYTSAYGKQGIKRTHDNSTDTNKAQKVTQANKQAISGTGNTNNTQTSTINIGVNNPDNIETLDNDTIDPELQKVIDKEAGNENKQILAMLTLNTEHTLRQTKEISGLKQKVEANTQSISKVEITVQTLTERVDSIERHQTTDNGGDMQDILTWTTTLRQSMIRALGQIRVVGFQPTNKQHAEELADGFLRKVFDLMQNGAEPPAICKFWHVEKQGKEWAITIGADPNLAQIMLTWNSQLHRLFPAENNRNRSYIYINPEYCPQFRGANRKYILISRDIRAIIGGHTKIKSKPDSLSLQLCYKRTKNQDYKPMYSFTPKHGVSTDDTPIKYLDRRTQKDPIATAVLFRKSRGNRTPIDTDWLSKTIITADNTFAEQNPLLFPISARDGTVIGYRIITTDFTHGEELYGKLEDQLRDKRIEVTHFGKSSDDKPKHNEEQAKENKN